VFVPKARAGTDGRRRPLCDVVHGLPVSNRDALANPESLELFRDLPQLAD
jgi:acetoacetyl-CoA synthetase